MSVRIFVPDIPEFAAIIAAGRQAPGCEVQPPMHGYWCLCAATTLSFERKPMKLGPALWNSLLSGGFEGHIIEYGRDRLVIASEPQGPHA